MPVRYDFRDAKFCTMDGMPIEIGNLTDATTEPEPGVEVGLTYANTPKEYTVTVTMDNATTFRRKIMRLAYGWQAKGPIRKRVLQKCSAQSWMVLRTRRRASASSHTSLLVPNRTCSGGQNDGLYR